MGLRETAGGGVRGLKLGPKSNNKIEHNIIITHSLNDPWSTKLTIVLDGYLDYY